MGQAGPNHFSARIVWTGNTGDGTAHYRAYDRTWDINVPGKPVVSCSNDPALGGDPTKMNPEDLLISSLAACHMLWFLHFASEAGVKVLAYTDDPIGHGETDASGAGRFVKAVLNPRIKVVTGTDLALAASLHTRVHDVCYIARSVAFPVEITPKFTVVEDPKPS